MAVTLKNEPRCDKTGLRCFLPGPTQNRAAQPQKIARLKISDLESGGLHYFCGKNKGADQLRGYCEADLGLCFRSMQKAGFLTMMKIIIDQFDQSWQKIKALWGGASEDSYQSGHPHRHHKIPYPLRKHAHAIYCDFSQP